MVFGGVERLVPHNILKLNPVPQHYKKVQCLKVKFRRAYNRRKLGEHYHAELKRLSKRF